MPASIKRIRESWNVKLTPRDKGFTLTLKVTAYDNGMVEVDGIPLNVEPNLNQGHGWLGAADVIITTQNEFSKDAAARRKQHRASPGHPRHRRSHVPIAHGQALDEEIADARLLPLEGAGHGIERTDWGTITHAIRVHTGRARP